MSNAVIVTSCYCPECNEYWSLRPNIYYIKFPLLKLLKRQALYVLPFRNLYFPNCFCFNKLSRGRHRVFWNVDFKRICLFCIDIFNITKKTQTISWFQTFDVLWMLFAFIWVTPRGLTFICRSFGIHCLFHLNPSAWGHLNPSSYCDVGRLFLRGI